MMHKLSNKRWNKEIALVVFNMWRRLTAYKVGRKEGRTGCVYVCVCVCVCVRGRECKDEGEKEGKRDGG
jgi:hypothetical protein